MSQCLNCKSTLGCGCQKRIASDGKSVCKSCIVTYENQLKKNNIPVQKSSDIIISNIKVEYTPAKL